MASKKILVVDDDPDLVEVIRLTLEASGYEVHSAASGTEGLEKVKEVEPDLIILDVMMDYTTEGFQVSLQLRSPDPTSEYIPYSKIPILMLTALHSTTSLRFGPDEDYLPVDDFVEKPLEPGALIQKVETDHASPSLAEFLRRLLPWAAAAGCCGACLGELCTR